MPVSQKEIRDYFAKFGKQGGKARAKNMTEKELKESASKAAKARWEREKKQKPNG